MGVHQPPPLEEPPEEKPPVELVVLRPPDVDEVEVDDELVLPPLDEDVDHHPVVPKVA